ncbi:SlyX family protein [Pelagovum pacificum]|uniref:SlyX family protein n=2 Tax=Pelagovum pacificum TaxID=2588711 RepID=A0A5C5G907_9RHOB|nr:SlyX family protein [Pelagovum pacificum]TNY31195.1 SlyX family protein [Pelagovum pacificum]
MSSNHALEERIAHLERELSDLSDVVSRQETEISTLLRRVRLLLEREAERETSDGDGVPLADQKPPHW